MFNETLDYILARASRLLGSDAEELYVQDESNPGMLRLLAHRNMPEDAVSPAAISQRFMSQAARHTRPVIAIDFQAILARPRAERDDEHLEDRGDYLEVVRPARTSAGDPIQQRRNRALSKHFRTLMAVPLLARGVSYGALTLCYRQKHPPTQTELELIAAFADQAGLAIENARMRQQEEQRTREADRRRQVAEGLQDLIAIVNSKRSLDEILDYVLVQARTLLRSDAESLFLRDPDNAELLQLYASRNLPLELRTPTCPMGIPLTGLAAAAQRPVLLPDLAALLTRPPVDRVEDQVVDRATYLELARPSTRFLVDQEQRVRNEATAQHFTSMIAIPLLARDESYGALTLHYCAEHVPPPDELALMAAFGGQAGLAIETARMREQEEQRTLEIDRRRRVAEGLRALVATVNSTRTLDEVLQMVVEQAANLIGSDATAIYLPETDTAEAPVPRNTHASPNAAAPTNAAAPSNAVVLRVRASAGLEEQYADTRVRVGVSATGHAFDRARPVAIYDVQQCLEEEGAATPELEERGNHLRLTRIRSWRGLPYRALLAVPLTVKDKRYGALSLYYAPPREFSDDDVALATAFADQVALAIENARLHNESEDRLREIEALYQADESLHRSLQLEDVLQTLCDLAIDIFRTEKASVWTWDEQTHRIALAASRGMSPSFRALSVRAEELVVDALAGDQVVTVRDLADIRHALNPAMNEILEREGVRSWMSANIRVAGQVFGNFAVGYTEPHAYSEAECRLLGALAQRAGLAIENARLYQQSEQRRRENAGLHAESEKQRAQLQALYQTDEALHRSLRLEDVVQALIDATLTLFKADGVAVFAPDARYGRSQPLATRGLTQRYLQTVAELSDDPAVSQFWWSQDEFAIEDILHDPRVPDRQRAALLDDAYRSILSTHIRVGEESFGSFTVGFRTPHTFEREERRLLVALAQRAGLAIQNARLYEQAQHAAALEERQRLARELHDAVTQTLFSTALIAEVIPDLWELDVAEARQRLAELRRLTRGALAEMRTLLIELRPGALTGIPLSDLLGQLAEAIAGRTRLEVKVEVAGQTRPLPPAVQVALYRVAQEALNNTVKYADARTVELELEYSDNARVRLAAVDDGRGFDVDAVPAGHLGLGIMRERSAAIGADFNIISYPGHGTRVEVHWMDAEEPTA